MTESPRPALRLTDVSLSRRGKLLLHNVNLEIAAGDRWVLMGPNGAGKTTLLQLATGHLHPSAGTVEILGEQLGRVDVFSLRRRIGLSSAALARRIPDTERVVDVVVSATKAIVGRWRETYTDAEFARASELLARFGMAGFDARAYGTLSEGERKRAQIARALMTDPELLLLDEPAAGMDVGAREDLVDTLSELALDPAAPTSVLVTHHVEEIPVGMTHAALLSHGGLVAAGPIDTVMTDEVFSTAFGRPLQIRRAAERWTAHAAAPASLG